MTIDLQHDNFYFFQISVRGLVFEVFMSISFCLSFRSDVLKFLDYVV